MHLRRLVVISNRVAIPDATGKAAAGGLAVALHETFQAYQGLWFGWSGKVSAHPAVQPKIIDKGQVQYAGHRQLNASRQDRLSWIVRSEARCNARHLGPSPEGSGAGLAMISGVGGCGTT